MNDHDLSPAQWEALGDVQPLMQRLAQYDVPEPDSERLLAGLQKFMPQPGTPRPTPVSKDWRYRLRLAHLQLSLVDRAFWWVSGLLLALGIILVFSSAGVIVGFFALVSPVLAVAGTAYIFRPETHSLREFELLSAVKPLELLYTRLLLILFYNTGLALTLILLAWSQDTQLVLWRLLLIWFGPMVGLTSIALYATLRWNTLAGIMMPMGLWTVMIFIGWQDTVVQARISPPLIELFMLSATQSDHLLILSMLILLLGLGSIWWTGRWAIYEGTS